MVERPEGNCINGVDDEKDGMTDRNDDDCVVRNGVSRIPRTLFDALIRQRACAPTGPENLATGNSCTDGTDNDCDGATDSADSECVGCTPTGPENLATGNSCTDGTDNDCDGATDAADSECVVPPPDCPDYAFYFGPTVTSDDHVVGTQNRFVISGRNIDAALGFQLGVRRTTAGGTTTFELRNDLGPDPQALIDLQYVVRQVEERPAQAGNRATASSDEVSAIERGAALAGFPPNDLFLVDETPGVGGPGFTVGYVADISDPGPGGMSRRIPATPPGTPTSCPLNELIVVRLGVVEFPFNRGDADGNSKMNVTDGILIIQVRIGNILARFNCDDILDANDNGTVELSDAVMVLRFVFMDGAPLPQPFRACGVDQSADALVCRQQNCTP